MPSTGGFECVKVERLKYIHLVYTQNMFTFCVNTLNFIAVHASTIALMHMRNGYKHVAFIAFGA